MNKWKFTNQDSNCVLHHWWTISVKTQHSYYYICIRLNEATNSTKPSLLQLALLNIYLCWRKRFLAFARYFILILYVSLKLSEEFKCHVSGANFMSSDIKCVWSWIDDTFKNKHHVFGFDFRDSVLVADWKVSYWVSCRFLEAGRGQCGGAVREIWWFSVFPSLSL